MWDDVIARVRGLSSRLLGRPTLEYLALSRDLAAFVKRLEPTSYSAVATAGVSVALVAERQTRRIAGDRLTTIADWCGTRAELLAPLFEDEDRRNLRALTRGVVAHVSPEQCAAGLLPTPTLPVASIQALAGEARIADLGATLVAWGNPYGAAILSEATRAHPDLFALQLAIDRTYAKRTAPIAKRAGAPVVALVRTIVDGENARAALAVAAGSVEHPSDALFIDGGQIITAALFRDLSALPVSEASASLARVVAGTVLAPLAAASSDDREAAVLTAMLRELRRAARRSPLSLSVVIEYVLALRAELNDLARIIWGIALRVPRRRIASRLVTP
ncbi:MAG TPA: V-type ATPase subunit [Gemmatimonadaceae bacterium]|jgi:vacuolar-type H+-ATPase subunit C/Vma6